MSPITVVVADNEPAGHRACESVLRRERDIRIVAHVNHHDEALLAALEIKPRVMLCGRRFAAVADYLLFETLHEKCPNTLILFWTDADRDANELIVPLAKGAGGFIDRAQLRRDLSRALRGLNKGEAWVPRSILGLVGKRMTT